MKDAQATEEAFCPQREHPAIQNIRVLHFFLCVFFALLASESSGTKSILIHGDPDPDPDPEHWYNRSVWRLEDSLL